MPTRHASLRRRTQIFAPLAAAVAASLMGCPIQSVIRFPPGVTNGTPASVTNPVTIRLDWSGVQYSSGQPSVGLDGASVTAQFNIGGGCCTAQATFTLPPGQHQVSVSIPRNATLGTYQEYLPFIVIGPGFTLAANPTSVSLTPGGTASTTVTATALNGFNGTVTPGAVTGLPAGVTATTMSLGAMQFKVNLTAAATATGSATATINASGTCAQCGGTVAATTSLAVAVVGPGLTISTVSATSILVPRGGTTDLNFTIQRTGGFSGAISLSATGASNGVTAPATTILAGQTSGKLTFNAATSAGLADVAGGSAPAIQNVTVTLSGQCTPACAGVTATSPVTVKIGRRAGQFVITPPTLKNATTNSTSADNTATLQYAPANPPPPPPLTLFTATYRRTPSTATLAAIDLAQSPNGWGAGFCTATPTVAGVVLSGTYGNQTNAQVFYILPIWAPPPATTQARTIFQPVYTQVTGVNLTITPTLWYSPDCTIAAFVEATGVAGTPETMTVIDMTSGNPIGQQQSFSGALPSRIDLVSTTAGQAVQLTFSPTDIRSLPIP